MPRKPVTSLMPGLRMVGKGVGTALNIAGKASRALALATRVASMVNAEKKYFDVIIQNSVNFDTTGACFCITAMGQGNDYNQRNGLSIKPKSIQYKFSLNIGSTNCIYRIIFFQDNESRQANPSPADVLDSVLHNSPLNHVNGKRFKILKDYYGELDTVKSPVKTVSSYIPLKGHIRYEGTSTGVANTDEGNVFILILSTGTGAAVPTIDMFSRLRYYDN